MREFLEKCSTIDKNLSQLKEYNDELSKQLSLKINSVLTDKEEMALFNKTETIIDNFRDLSKNIKKDIKENKNQTLKLSKNGAKPFIIENRDLYTFKHAKKLSEIIGSFNSTQNKYREEEKDKLKCILNVSKPDLHEEEISKMIDEDGDALLASSFSLGSHSAQNVLNEAKHRKKKIEKIVETISILVRLIEEIEDILKNNTTKIDKIEINMASAEENTKQANTELESALSYEIRAMRIKRILAILGIIIIFVFLAWLLGGVFRRKNNTNNQSNQQTAQTQ